MALSMLNIKCALEGVQIFDEAMDSLFMTFSLLINERLVLCYELKVQCYSN